MFITIRNHRKRLEHAVRTAVAECWRVAARQLYDATAEKLANENRIAVLERDRDKWRQDAREHKALLEQAILVNHELVRQANAKQAPGREFTPDEIRTLIRLCHPDKHGGSESANTITQKLLKLRG